MFHINISDSYTLEHGVTQDPDKLVCFPKCLQHFPLAYKTALKEIPLSININCQVLKWLALYHHHNQNHKVSLLSRARITVYWAYSTNICIKKMHSLGICFYQPFLKGPVISKYNFCTWSVMANFCVNLTGHGMPRYLIKHYPLSVRVFFLMKLTNW